MGEQQAVIANARVMDDQAIAVAVHVWQAGDVMDDYAVIINAVTWRHAVTKLVKSPGIVVLQRRCQDGVRGQRRDGVNPVLSALCVVKRPERAAGELKDCGFHLAKLSLARDYTTGVTMTESVKAGNDRR